MSQSPRPQGCTQCRYEASESVIVRQTCGIFQLNHYLSALNISLHVIYTVVKLGQFSVSSHRMEHQTHSYPCNQALYVAS